MGHLNAVIVQTEDEFNKPYSVLSHYGETILIVDGESKQPEWWKIDGSRTDTRLINLVFEKMNTDTHAVEKRKIGKIAIEGYECRSIPKLIFKAAMSFSRFLGNGKEIEENDEPS